MKLDGGLSAKLNSLTKLDHLFAMQLSILNAFFLSSFE